jgi:hypothetical protein
MAKSLKTLTGEYYINTMGKEIKTGCDEVQEDLHLKNTKIFSNYPNLPEMMPENVFRVPIENIINKLEDYFVYEFNKIIYNMKPDDEKWIRIFQCFKNLDGDFNKLGKTVFPTNLLTRAHYNRPLYDKLITYYRGGDYHQWEYKKVNDILELLFNFNTLKTLEYIEKDNIIKLGKYYIFYHWSIHTLDIDTEKPFVKPHREFSILNIINLQDFTGQTTLMKAAWDNNLEIVKLLLERGANVNLQRSSGETALMDAVVKNNIEIIKLLIEHGADINIKDIENQKAIDRTKDPQIIKMLSS